MSPLEYITLLHPVKISDDMVHFFIIVRNIHSVMELDTLRFELGLEDFESLRELPFRSYHYDLSISGSNAREGEHTARHQ